MAIHKPNLVKKYMNAAHREEIIFTKGATEALNLVLYWSMEPKDFTYLSGKVSLQGNLNPKILLESNDIIKRETYKILDAFQNYPGYIFNLGHGITQFTPPENVTAMLDPV